MFERFTERARQVVVLAQDEARILEHNHIGTEHILLGLLREGEEEEGLAARVLESLGITAERVRAEVVRVVGSGYEVTSGQIPFTSNGKKVLELSLREALSLGHNHIGTEHILLGLARVDEGVAMRILLDSGVDYERIRYEVIRVPSDPGGIGRAGIAAWLGELGTAQGELAALERELGRQPDAGDLLIALTSFPGGVVDRTLSELGVDPDRLCEAVVKARRAARAVDPVLDQARDAARREKEEALAAQDFDRAARHGYDERALDERITRTQERRREFREQVRRRLGLTD